MNLVIGTYSGYTSNVTAKGGLLYFVKSLRRHNTECKIVVICEKEHVYPELVTLCQEYNAEIYSDFVVRLDKPYEPIFEVNLMGGVFRFLAIAKYLDENVNCFDKILMADMNDLVFQADPFSIEFDTDLYCALEVSRHGYERVNLEWIMEVARVIPFDRSLLFDQPVICYGTVLGTDKGVRKWIQFYREVFSHGTCNDQGLFNVYIYCYDTDKTMGDLILTLDRVPFESLKFRDGLAINDRGEVYPIVHQINRSNLSHWVAL
jgi:hypothetical protein